MATSQTPHDTLQYTLHAFDQRPAFSSFLPGIAGQEGIPLWAFYVNRGQALASFGVANKDQAILEFLPANKAYQQVAYRGFRTFLKLDGRFYEPFAPWSAGSPQRSMHIRLNELELVETNPQTGLETRVLYFVLPQEPIAALVRQVTIVNSGDAVREIELLDGLPGVVCYGADNGALKHISRTIEAWMQVENHQSGVPLYRLRASAADTAQVTTIAAGHFAVAMLPDEMPGQRLPAIVDPDLVFAQESSLQNPVGFVSAPLESLLAQTQITSGKTPAAFFAHRTRLQPGQSLRLVDFYGHTPHLQALEGHLAQLSAPEVLAEKQAQARLLAAQITAPIATRSKEPLLDAYCRQTFLDNVLRGGMPVQLGASTRHVYYVYSRKHGDLERDYNDFYLAPEYFSQGNGNFRDVAQNRRNDVWFWPETEDFNVRLHLSLIQSDGYNPLVLQGIRFTLAPGAQAQLAAESPQPEKLFPLLQQPFTPGSLLKTIETHAIPLHTDRMTFLARAISLAQPEFQADHGEGYWVDHWTYLLDLIESYLAIYPDRKTSLLHEKRVPFFDNPHQVQPRSERYVLTPQGPRQYHALRLDLEKQQLIASRPHAPQWTRTAHGRGEIFTVTVFEKLLLLALIKCTTRDPWGMGVEMEAGKPGWYDALNGLPALFGSSMPESYELLRLLRFLRQMLASGPAPSLPIEANQLLTATLAAIQDEPFSSLPRWERLNDAREAYRQRTRLGFSGETVTRPASDWPGILDTLIQDVERGQQRATALTDGIPPTYFSWEVTHYENAPGETRYDASGQIKLRPLEMRPHPLPPFLEGAVRAMKVLSPDDARTLHTRMLDGPLWDAPLGMFKVNASLQNESYEIGRARAFPPGWLENESIWLHMHYKYLLELLKQGLYTEFFAIARTGLIPFRDPAQYGRSPLENSSFLVSSTHVDPALHGRGFVARLSGATAEFLHMWTLMTAGPQPFVMTDAGLTLRLRPALPGWLFTDDGRFEFTFLGRIPVLLHNPARRDLFPGVPRRIVLTVGRTPAPDRVFQSGQSGPDRLEPPAGDRRLSQTITGADVPPPWAERVRDGAVKKIELFF